MRVDAGCFRAREGRDGSKVYLHRLADAPRAGTEIPQLPAAQAKRADPDTLHAVYSAVLEHLPLSQRHREALQRRGLPDSAIDRGRYRTLPRQGRPRIVRDLRERFGDKLLRVPGFVTKEGRSGRYLTLRGPAGLIVPCRDHGGRIIALKVRRDDAGEGGPRYLYLSSEGHGGPGSGAPVHHPVGTPEAAELVRLIEGELKADIVQALTGVPTVAVPGVSSWRLGLTALNTLSCGTVRLAFDADSEENATLARSLCSCADVLAAAGFALQLERWAAGDGKGLDDLLAAGKTPEVLQGDAALQAVSDILAAATAGDEPGPPDELARLQEVLDAGGPEAMFRDKALMQALADLAAADPAGFAAVRASIRQRVSVRDLDKTLRSFRATAPPADGPEAPPYFEERGWIYHNAINKDGPVPVALCNFCARIVEDLEYDDGAERARLLAIDGTLANGTPLGRAEIPADAFPRMEWIVPAWGTRAVVFARMGTKDHLRAALQLLSGDVPRRTVYRHLGWRKISETWFYLHADGAIGPDGLANDIPVSLPEALAYYKLTEPPTGSALGEAVRASLGLLCLGPDRLTFPLLSAVYRAVLGESDFGLHLAGPTGTFKSEAASLAQQHFGVGLDARNLPASWMSTGNALEALAFVAKDALLTVDDFCPSGSVADVQRHHKEADRLFRGQGNRAGRQRLRPDATLRPPKPPRGMTLSTGEDTPRGQSLRARLLVLEVSGGGDGRPGDFGPQPPEPNPALSACQRDAAEGKYAASLAGFLRWLAPQYGAVRGRQKTELAELRERAYGDGQHARTPGIVAGLALGLSYFLDFALAAGAISDTERTELWRRGWAALVEAGAGQAAQISTGEPGGLFLRLLWAAVASGYAHIADEQGDAPREPQRWGWRRDGDMQKPQGVRVGWLAEGGLYLEPDSSYAAVQRFARDQGDSFPVSAHTLRRRLKDKGLLAATDTARSKLTVRKTLQGERREVLHIIRTGAPSASNNGPMGADGVGGAENGAETRASSRAGNGQANCAATNNAITAGIPGQSRATIGPELGRLGRLGTGEDGTTGAESSEQQSGAWGGWQ
jgi:hypothetical protein